MVYRIYVEKRPAFAQEAEALKENLRSFLNISALERVRMLNRYDAERIEPALFERCKHTVFSEPQTDLIYESLPEDCANGGCAVFAVEYLPGQFDQRADSAAQCIQLISQQERPVVRNARVYLLYGALAEDDVVAIKRYLINPVDSREAVLELPDTLIYEYEAPEPVPVLTGFIGLDGAGLQDFLKEYGLAMDLDDLKFCQNYFREEKRDPTLTELRVIDTYWSDHCRHTTFLTNIDKVSFDHPAAQRAYEDYLSLRRELGVKKPVTLMDMATIAAKYLKKTGKLDALDESDEINACTVKVDVNVNGRREPWLLLFKNETHNHPTEIEPFGGAATCIGGAIRDPLSGRAYVYQAMRVTGAGNPLQPLKDTPKGKLPQRKIVREAAAGYSSYGNQIGLATGLVDEIYHPGYAAKHMEIGAVVGAAPQSQVRREQPAPGDVVLLIGGRTGRDGCGGATGSSKTHSLSSLESCGAEVQKGNAPEERKLQRLFRNPEAARLIKRCNDFGAGGVSVAIGELADGLTIELDAVPKKYEGLTGTELAISESQERMAVLVEEKDAARFMVLAAEENLEATPVAHVQAEARLIMNQGGRAIVDISREFLNTNGAEKHANAHVNRQRDAVYPFTGGTVRDRLFRMAADLNVCSKRGLIERFDSTIGAGSVLMPLGGERQRTPAQAMAAKFPVLYAQTSSCSVMAYGFDPCLSEADPYAGAYCAVVESVAKLVASGAELTQCYLTFQEYFERLRQDDSRWGKPLAALLGALRAQLDLGLAAIGGKDSMSGSFEELDVPPTLVSFAVAAEDTAHIVSPEFKRAGSRIALLAPEYDENGLPKPDSLKKIWGEAQRLLRCGRALSAWTPVFGGVVEGLFKMTLGNRIGCKLTTSEDMLFARCCGGLLLETLPEETAGTTLGMTMREYAIAISGEVIPMEELERAYNATLEPIYPTRPAKPEEKSALTSYRYEKGRIAAPAVRVAKPRALIPVFPGTNCEYDTAAALRRAGAEPKILVVRNLTASDIAQSAQKFAQSLGNSQILFIPGGFSGGDEPDGSGKFITAFLRNPRIAEGIAALLSRDGLICGICNGFQALIKLGLLPYGEIRDMDETCPTLTFNEIGRHQSRLVRTRVASNLSPWLMHANVDDLHVAPVSHGEGRFVCGPELLAQLAQNGQIATQYVDEAGRPTMEIDFNPNGSVQAIEGITSPDGRIFGKMAHTERAGNGLYKNGPDGGRLELMRGAVDYFA
jgi:phosphoribosylformylglycinamidine synthase